MCLPGENRFCFNGLSSIIYCIKFEFISQTFVIVETLAGAP